MSDYTYGPGDWLPASEPDRECPDCGALHGEHFDDCVQYVARDDFDDDNHTRENDR